ncbi:unnamed protein product, partial [Discosporangium mesarthrocarpum]
RGTLLTGQGLVQVRQFSSERSLLEGWRDWVVFELDPDILLGFDLVGSDIWCLKSRFSALGVTPGLTLGRRTGPFPPPQTPASTASKPPSVPDISSSGSRLGKLGVEGSRRGKESSSCEEWSLQEGGRVVEEVSVKRVVNYGKEWVRKQARMSAVSNQECFQLKGC